MRRRIAVERFSLLDALIKRICSLQFRYWGPLRFRDQVEWGLSDDLKCSKHVSRILLFRDTFFLIYENKLIQCFIYNVFNVVKNMIKLRNKLKCNYIYGIVFTHPWSAASATAAASTTATVKRSLRRGLQLQNKTQDWVLSTLRN